MLILKTRIVIIDFSSVSLYKYNGDKTNKLLFSTKSEEKLE